MSDMGGEIVVKYIYFINHDGKYTFNLNGAKA
jgi:hypothetical protein